VAPSFLSGTTSRLLLVRREGLDWSKDTTASATAVLDNYGKHVGELDHLIQPVALRVQVTSMHQFSQMSQLITRKVILVGRAGRICTQRRSYSLLLDSAPFKAVISSIELNICCPCRRGSQWRRKRSRRHAPGPTPHYAS